MEQQFTKEQLVEEFRTILDGDVAQIKEKADQLKTQFYRLYRSEQEAARKQWEELEDKVGEFTPIVDQTEQEFKALLQTYKEKRQAMQKALDEELAQNQLRKENIIAQMKQLAESETADVSQNIQTVRELQQEWKQIGAVSPTVATSLWKQYNMYQEQFYDLVKINNELREYDFKKNLEQKSSIIDEARSLAESEDVVAAFRRLQQLHADWSNIGPVARELREEIWNNFKEASTVINKKHQDFFEKLHGMEAENEQRKRQLIEKLKEIDINSLTTNKMWDEANEKITEIQQEWRTIGFAPKKVNQKIYDEYREICNQFFTAKTAFYKKLRDDLQHNLQLKRELIEQANELKDSDEWKETSDKLIKLQQEWRKIGAVSRKYSDDVWKQFNEACDHFFERKKLAQKGQNTEEKENLEKKRNIIAQIEAIEVGNREETLAQLNELIKQFNSIGYVPIREKDKIQKQLRAASDKIYDALQVERQHRRMDAFERSVEDKDENALLAERRRLVRQYENLQQDIKTAENNILFFTSNSKKSNKLVEDMQRKINDLRKQADELEQRVNLIDSKID